MILTMTTFNDTIRIKYNTDNKTDIHKKVLLLFLLLLIDIKDITDDGLIYCNINTKTFNHCEINTYMDWHCGLYDWQMIDDLMHCFLIGFGTCTYLSYVQYYKYIERDIAYQLHLVIDSNMYALVKFYDGIYYVCKSNSITINQNSIKATYSDKRKYPANIIAKNDNRNILQEIKQNISSNKPRVLCMKLYLQNVRNVTRKYKLSTKYKNCDKKRIIYSCKNMSDDINTTTTFNTIRNYYKTDNKTDIHKKDCAIEKITDGSICRIDKQLMSTDGNRESDTTNIEKNCENQKVTDLPMISTNDNRNDCYNQVQNNNTGMNDFYDDSGDSDMDKLLMSTGEYREIVRMDEAENYNYEEMTNFLTSFDTNSMIFIDENGNDCHSTVRRRYKNDGTEMSDFDDNPVDCNVNTLLLFNDKNNENNRTITKKDCDYHDITDFPTPDIDTFVMNKNENNCFNKIQNKDDGTKITESDDNPIDCDLLNKSTFPYDLDNCVKRLTFNTTDIKESSGSEYIPSEDEQHLLSDNESPREQKSVLSINVSSSLDGSQINDDVPICNDEEMYVESSNVKGTKKNYCVFCSKWQTQLARHLEKVHCNEPEVKKFAVLPKKNAERKKIIDILRKRGNFKFNTNANLNDGQLIVSRRPNEKYNKVAKDFIPCAKCKGFFAKSTIRHHARNCFRKNFKKHRCVMVMGRKIASRLHSSANETLKTVFSVLQDCDVTRVIRYDGLLIAYANKLCIKYRSQHHHDMIRAKLRLLGRFLLALKDINKNVEDFESLYHPKIYDDCIRAINIVAKYNNEDKMYETPAVAANLSTLIKHIGNFLIAECIKREDSEKKKLVKDFVKLLIVDIGTSVNKTVIETQSAQKRRKKLKLPSLEDIKKLYKHLNKKRLEAFKALQESFSYHDWLSLAEVTLTSIQLFNRRRAGEIERILIEDFKSYEKIHENMHCDIYKSLSNENKKIADKYIRFCIRGKLGRTVPVLLSNDLFESVNLILKFRKEAEIPHKNPYVFGLPGLNKQRYRYLRACLLLRRFSKECNASQSTTLRGTILRKHVATYCIQLNLSEIDVTDLATFMGHTEKIHKDHYRQPLASRDILKISQYLEAVQGNLNNENESSDSDFENDKIKDNFDNNNSAEENNYNSNNSTKDSNCDDTNLIEDLDDNITPDKQKDSNGKRKRSTSPYGKTKRVRWSQREQETALLAFAKYMENLQLPSLKEIQEVKKKYSALAHRTSPQIKTWLHNKQKVLR